MDVPLTVFRPYEINNAYLKLVTKSGNIKLYQALASRAVACGHATFIHQSLGVGVGQSVGKVRR